MKGGAVAASMAAAPALNNWAFAKKIEKLEKEGWTKHPVACTMCGAFCGLLAMRKDGEPLSEHSVRIFPNPGHPQQGYCGRSAAAMWVWNRKQCSFYLPQLLRLQQVADFPSRFSE